MGKMMRRLLEGDEVVTEWSADDPASVAAANRVLQNERLAGYFSIRNDLDTPAPNTEIAPEAKEILLTMPMGGG